MSSLRISQKELQTLPLYLPKGQTEKGLTFTGRGLERAGWGNEGAGSKTYSGQRNVFSLKLPGLRRGFS